MKRTHNLYRVSTKKQVDIVKDDIPLQRIACNQFAEQKGWIVTKEFEEKGISGFKVSAAKRDAIQDLKEAALRDEFDVLLVFMFDRIGRIDDETPFVVEWFVKHGIEVWSVQEGEQRFDNHTDKLLNYIRFWQASGESEKLSIRIKERKKQLTSEGFYTGGTVPIGYKLVYKGRVNKKGTQVKDLEIDPHEAELVRLIFSKTLNDGYGSYRIANFLNSKGFRTHNGAIFQSTTIARVLNNRLYCGFIISGESTSKRMEELQIISDDDYNRAQFILKQRDVKKVKKRHIALQTKGETLLAGNLFCGVCGGRMSTYHYTDKYMRKDGSEYSVSEPRYVCNNRARKRGGCNGQATYTAEIIDKVVIEIIKKIFNKFSGSPGKEKFQSLYEKKIEGNREEQKKIGFEINKSKKKHIALQEEVGKALIGESVFSEELLEGSIKVIEDKMTNDEIRILELKKEEEQLEKIIDRIVPTCGKFKSWADEFFSTSFEQRKMIACYLFTRIYIKKDEEYEIGIEMNCTYQQFCSEWDFINDN